MTPRYSHNDSHYLFLGQKEIYDLYFSPDDFSILVVQADQIKPDEMLPFQETRKRAYNCFIY